MAAGITYHGYTNHMGGDATSRFTIRGQIYEYHMSKRNAEIVHWLSKKGTGKALNLAKKRAYDVKKAADGEFAIRFWTPLKELHEKWEKLRDKYEPLGRRSIAWPKPEPKDGEWRYWAGGAWSTSAKSARLFDTIGSATGAAKRHKIRGLNVDVEVVVLKRGRPSGKGQRVAKRGKAKTKFMRPENWDVAHKHSDYNVWAGGNDWESGNTWMWVEQRDKRLWVQIDHSKHPEDESSGADNPELNEHGKKAVDTWLKVAKDIARADHEADMAEREEHQKTWKWSGQISMQFFEDALRDKRMKGFVEAQGYEVNVWKPATAAQQLTRLASNIIIADQRKKFNLKTKYNFWNNKLFSGDLPDIPMKWNRSRTFGGAVYKRYIGKDITQLVKMTISDYLVLDEERFDAILIHEMIHVWQGVHNIREGKGGHGPQFRKMAQSLGGKAGFSIPLTEDITELEVSDNVATKEFVVVLFKARGKASHLLFNMSNWNRNRVKFKADLERLAMSYSWAFTVVRSSERSLLKMRTKNNIIGKRGSISWMNSDAGFHDTIMSGGTVIENMKATKFNDRKPRGMLTGIGKFIAKRLGDRFPTSKFVSDVKTTKTMANQNLVSLTVKSGSGRGVLLVQVFLDGEKPSGLNAHFQGTSMEFLWGDQSKYPTPQTIMDALDRKVDLGEQAKAFGATLPEVE